MVMRRRGCRLGAGPIEGGAAPGRRDADAGSGGGGSVGRWRRQPTFVTAGMTHEPFRIDGSFSSGQ